MPSTEADEFTLDAPATPKGPPAEKAWYFPTNQLNLMFMIASGLVTGPAGFGHKYYADALAVHPGWIPVFADAVPTHALTQAEAEGKHLRRVIAELDLSSLGGTVQALDQNGNLRAIQFPMELSDSDVAMFIPAPLPATWIRAIHFTSREERADIEEEASDYANVPFKTYKRKVSARLFSRRSACPWPPEKTDLPERDMSTHRIGAIGGAMALAFALANRGDETVEAARLLFGTECGPLGQGHGREQSAEPLLDAFRVWACLDDHVGQRDIQNQLLLSILHALVDAKVRVDRDDGSVSPDLHQTVLDVLATEQERLAEQSSPAASERLVGLTEDLKGLLGLGAHTVSELLSRHPKPFSRALLLLFLRDRPEGLLELDSPGLNPMDFAVAATLFAARSGWMGLPPEVREQAGLHAAVVHRMAALAHRQAGSGVELGQAPARIVSLREIFLVTDGSWSRRQNDAALTLARGMGWGALLRTRISLGKGEYRLEVDGRGAHLLLEGDVKAVSTEVHRSALLDRLSATSVPPKVDAAVRNILEGGRV